MERVKSCVVGEMVIDPPLLDEVFNNIKMSIEAGIQKSSESLIILLIHPYKYLLILILLEELFIFLLMQSFFGLFDKESYDIKMSLKGELM